MALNQSSSAVAKVVKQLANKIINSSSRPEIRSLFADLTQTLNTTSNAHYNSALEKSQLSAIPTKRFPFVLNAYNQILKLAEEYEDDSNQKHHKRMVQQETDSFRGNGEKDEEEKPKLSTSNATYGETPPETISSLLNLLSNHHDGGRSKFPGDFVDAGSGRGGVSCVAALEGMFDKCRGIEYDMCHSQAAFTLEMEYKKYNTQQQQIVSDDSTKEERYDIVPSQELEDFSATSSCVQFICGDLGDETFEGASVVYSNAVVWDSQLCSTLGHILDDAKLQQNAFVVTATKKFSLPSFELVDMLQLSCNGGQLFTFYINQKRNDCGSYSTVSSSEIDRGAAPAVSDSEFMRLLRSTNENSKSDSSSPSSNMMEVLVAVSLQDGGLEGLAFLSALAASESNVRCLCSNQDLLNSLVSSLELEDGPNLPTRASASILLRSLSAFSIGRRTIAQDDRLLDAMFSSLVVSNQLAKNDHVLIRANIVDSLGEVLKDHVGNDVLANRGIDSVVANLLDNTPEAEMLTEACQAVMSFRQWRLGKTVP